MPRNNPKEGIVPYKPTLASPAVVSPEERQRQNRFIVLAIISSNVFGLFITGLFEYFSLRGVMNIAASRIVLFFAWLLGVAVCIGIVWATGVVARVRTVIVSAAILGLALIVTDHWVSGLTEKNEYSDWLMPANLPMPMQSCGIKEVEGEGGKIVVPSGPSAIPNGYSSLFIGSSTISEKGEFAHVIIQFKDAPILTLERKNGHIAVSLEIFDSDPDPKIIAKIEHNKFTINRLNVFEKTVSDDRSRLQIADQHNKTVLDVQYINKRAIRISADLYFPGPPTVGPLIIGSNDIRLSALGQTFIWDQQCYQIDAAGGAIPPLINLYPSVRPIQSIYTFMGPK